MANLGVSKRTMANIFIMMVIVGSVSFGIYIILSTKLSCSREEFDAMCENEECSRPMCDISAHEVPIWEGSLIPETAPEKPREIDQEYAKPKQAVEVTSVPTSSPSKPSKYSFINNEVDMPVETPAVQTTERKFIGDLPKPVVVNRPKSTQKGIIKQPRGSRTGLGFNTGAMN